MNEYKQVIEAVTNLIGNNCPEIRARQVINHKAYLSEIITNYHNNQIAYGPLKGFRFSDKSHWGKMDRGTMILGLYESEILDLISKISANHNVLIDLGAADGYYGCGLLVNNHFEKSYCFEIDPFGRDVIGDTAKANNIAEKVAIRGAATSNFYDEIDAEDIEKSFILCDVEGAEFDIFTEDVFKKFSNSTIVVELHDFFFDDSSAKFDKLISNSVCTHNHKIIKMGSRNLSEISEIANWNDFDRWLLCSESRPKLMSWIHFTPK